MNATSAPSHPARTNVPRVSVAEAAVGVVKHGDNSWPLCLFEFVDDFRATRDGRLVEPPPSRSLAPRIYTIFACTVEALCHELGIETPDWALDTPPLKDPWFVAGFENLKVMALIESPAWFRRRNVFVLGNFLDRA